MRQQWPLLGDGQFASLQHLPTELSGCNQLTAPWNWVVQWVVDISVFQVNIVWSVYTRNARIKHSRLCWNVLIITGRDWLGLRAVYSLWRHMAKLDCHLIFQSDNPTRRCWLRLIPRLWCTVRAPFQLVHGFCWKWQCVQYCTHALAYPIWI